MILYECKPSVCISYSYMYHLYDGNENFNRNSFSTSTHLLFPVRWRTMLKRLKNRNAKRMEKKSFVLASNSWTLCCILMCSVGQRLMLYLNMKEAGKICSLLWRLWMESNLIRFAEKKLLEINETENELRTWSFVLLFVFVPVTQALENSNIILCERK